MEGLRQCDRGGLPPEEGSTIELCPAALHHIFLPLEGISGGIDYPVSSGPPPHLPATGSMPLDLHTQGPRLLLRERTPHLLLPPTVPIVRSSISCSLLLFRGTFLRRPSSNSPHLLLPPAPGSEERSEVLAYIFPPIVPISSPLLHQVQHHHLLKHHHHQKHHHLQSFKIWHRLSDCLISEKGCGFLASALSSNPSHLKLLDISYNHLGESGLNLLSARLEDPVCKLEILKYVEFCHNSVKCCCRFADCKLTDKSCEIVASVLQSPNSLLQLDLSDNDLGDSGVQLLSKGLSSFNCKIHTLRLSDCLISEKGCGFLASALSSNPSHLKLLDINYNHLGESGLNLLSARLEDPVCKLEILKTDHASLSKARPRLLRYACDLTLDPNTAHRRLSLSEGNRKVTHVREQQPYPEHPERFDSSVYPQVLCREGLTGRCYWEAEWIGDGAVISVAYKSIKRKGDSYDVIMGLNAKSWSLNCSPHRYSVWHNNKHTAIPAPSSRSRTVGVYLDWPAGTLSFYSVSTDTLTQLHTFHSTFTEPLYPGFLVWGDVSLCKIT
ncbi:uncharacterized protein LOC143131367 [Alosa pseudoharengus]|uniref:uncharacterized protein LOC143131367 n=1 Tax=Alosa pseudoharengus TaxID=34774 RepID=UPI003F891A9E